MSSVSVTDCRHQWREALARYYPRVRGWFTQVLVDGAAVDDLTQEVFARLCDRLMQGEVVLNPWNYIKVIARNVFREHLRAQRAEKVLLPLEEGLTADLSPEPADVCAQKEVSAAIPQLLAHLPVAQRQILIGRYFLGLTIRELARDMGVATSTVTERHNRAMCHLRTLALSRGITL